MCNGNQVIQQNKPIGAETYVKMAKRKSKNNKLQIKNNNNTL